jgi:hypothetical protein
MKTNEVRLWRASPCVGMLHHGRFHAPPRKCAHRKKKKIKPLQAILSESYENAKCFKRFEINVCARTGGQIKKAPGRKKLKPLQATRRTQISTQFMKTDSVSSDSKDNCVHKRETKNTHTPGDNKHLLPSRCLSFALSLSLSLSRSLALLSLCSRSLVMEHSIITS